VLTISCILPICDYKFSFVSAGESILYSPKNAAATAINASSGQGKNQLIHVALNIPGNFCALSLNFDPTGENAKTM